MTPASLAVTLGQAGATILGGALAGPAGAALAPQIVGWLAEAFGVEATPEAVEKAVATNPQAGAIVRQVEADNATTLLDLQAKALAREAANDQAEAEKGFGAWQMRRTVTTYSVLAMLCGSFFATLAAALGLIRADTALLASLVTHAVTLFMAWNGLVSGGRALTDIATAVSAGRQNGKAR
jgi:hypothetical protein